MSNPLRWYDFTCSVENVNFHDLKQLLKDNCSKWSFQKEKGEKTGYLHYQGRFCLNDKKRKNGVINLFGGKDCGIHFSVTTTQNRNNFDYVTKDRTRVDGPWSHKDIEKYIPLQYRGKLEQLRPFQRDIWDSYDEFDDRIINCIVCPVGNIGKSMISSLCDLYDRGYDIPPINDSEKLIQSVCDILMCKKDNKPGMFLIDIPRSTRQDKLHGLFNSIEQIKKGKVYDMRYKYKEWWFDSPTIWVFMNEVPNLTWLSDDRWRIWNVDKDYQLIEYNDGIKSITEEINEMYENY